MIGESGFNSSVTACLGWVTVNMNILTRSNWHDIYFCLCHLVICLMELFLKQIGKVLDEELCNQGTSQFEFCSFCEVYSLFLVLIVHVSFVGY